MIVGRRAPLHATTAVIDPKAEQLRPDDLSLLVGVERPGIAVLLADNDQGTPVGQRLQDWRVAKVDIRSKFGRTGFGFIGSGNSGPVLARAVTNICIVRPDLVHP